jgi:hypothetical protein
MAFPNRHPGKCSVCSTKVGAGDGLCYKDNGRWLVVCASSQCQARALGKDAPATGPDVRELRADGTLVMAFDHAALPLIKGMPGARWNKADKTWSVSTAMEDRPRVLEVAARLGLTVAPELAEIVLDDDATEAVERARKGGAYPYQLEGVRHLAMRRRSLLGDDMGLGKTLQSLMALPADGRAIVICPSSLKLNWRNEAKRWRPDLRVAVLKGRGSFRMPERGEIVILNYEIAPTPEDRCFGWGTNTGNADWPAFSALLAAWAETTVIVDEVHRAKNTKRKSKDPQTGKAYPKGSAPFCVARTASVHAFSESAHRVVFLTGTPLLNRPFDLWGVLEAGGMSKDVFGSFGGFLRCFNAEKGRWGGYEFGGPDASVPERLRRVMLRRTKAEVLPDLPAKTRTTMVVNDLPAGLRAELDAAYDDWCDEYGGGEPDALPDFREFSALRAKLAESRIPAAIEWCEDREEEGAPVLVFSAHRAPVEAIGAREGWAMILGGTPVEERQRIVDDFQAGKLKGVALTITAGGVGLTLTRASTALFVDSDWTPGNNLQAEDRMVRIGQTASSVQIVRMCSEHVLDAHVLNLLDQKVALIEAAIEKQAAYAPKPAAARPTTVEETAEEWEARMEAHEVAILHAEAKVEYDAAKRRIDEKLESLHMGGVRLPKSFTPEQADALRGAVRYLASVCDYAREKDDAGFNKPDAHVGHWLALVGMDNLPELQLAWAISRKYVRQAGTMFPAAFPLRAVESKSEVA